MTRRKPPATKATLLDAVRAAVKSAGGNRIRLKSFLGSAPGISATDIYAHYPSWNALLRAAGFHFDQHNQRIPDTALLADWATVTRKLQRPPTAEEYRRHGTYSLAAITRRFQGWNPIREAFRTFATAQPQWDDVISLLPPPDKNPPARKEPSPLHPSSFRLHPSPTFRSPYMNGRPICGDPLNLDALLTAPVNETGVLFLFAILAPRLGFRVLSLQSRFPDCEARRSLWPGTWQTVRIEFEFESRNFRDHGHPPDGCDIIVCWNHNWPDCPENLEVIALNECITRFASEFVS